MKPYTKCKRCGERVEEDGGMLTYGYISLSAKRQKVGWSIQSVELCESCQISFRHWLDDPQYDNENYILRTTEQEGAMKHGRSTGVR